jgi:glycosyltransferase involved in cell wall biosynthesis
MKILIANHRYFVSSGPERYLFNIIARLQKAGHSIVPFSVDYAQNEPTPYSEYFVPSLGKPDQVYFDEHRSSLSAIPRTLGRLFYSREVERAVDRLVEETQPDLAYILHYLRKLSPSILVALKKHKIPIVVRLSDYGMFCAEHHCLRNNEPCALCTDGSLMHSVRYKCVKGSRALSLLDAMATGFHRWKRYFDLVDVYVTTNPFMHEMMAKAGYPKEKLLCIPTFTDTEMFAPAPADTPRTAIVSICRLDPPKGLHILVEAMRRLHQRKGNSIPQLTIAGTGHNAAYVAALKAGVTAAGLQNKIVFAGHVKATDMSAFLRGALCSVIPALWFENLPNSLIESLACGVPVIASDIGSLSSAITNGHDGLLHRPGDADDLAEKIDRLTSNPVLQARLSENSRRTALTKYSPETHTASLLALFEKMLGQPSENRTGESFARPMQAAT